MLLNISKYLKYNIHHIKIVSTFDININYSIYKLIKCNNLEHLNITFLNMNNYGSCIMEKEKFIRTLIFHTKKTLNSLKLDLNNNTCIFNYSELENLKYLHNLNKLEIDLTNVALNNNIDVLLNFKHLFKLNTLILNLTNCNITDINALISMNDMYYLKKLKLNFSKNNIKNEHINISDTFLDTCSDFNKLETLKFNFSDNLLDINGVNYLLTLIKSKCINVLKLKINNNVKVSTNNMLLLSNISPL
jgi:hypothetical protein